MDVVAALRATKPIDGSVNVVAESADRVIVEVVGGNSARRIISDRRARPATRIEALQ